MSPAVLIVTYCVLTILASLVGGWLPSLIKLTHLRRQMMMSLVSGVILGVALLHMLPHSVEYLRSPTWVGGSMLCGLLVMFFLLRVFHVHSHDSAHVDHRKHDHHHEHEHDQESGTTHQFSLTGLFVGLSIHSLLDGVAMAASVLAEASHDHPAIAIFGFGTFLAVFLHKPLDALAITSLMRAADWSDGIRMLVNCLFALTCPVGALLFWLGTSQISDGESAFVGCALAFSAGFFLCIALSDLLPEVAFHSHDRVKLTAAFLLGVALSIGIEMLHTHEQQHDDGHVPHQGHDHLHGSHDH